MNKEKGEIDHFEIIGLQDQNIKEEIDENIEDYLDREDNVDEDNIN